MSRRKNSYNKKKKNVKKGHRFNSKHTKTLSIANKVKVKRNDLSIPKIKLDEDKKEEEEFDIDSLSETHLQILMSKVKEDKSWTHIHERLLAVIIYMAGRVDNLERNKISDKDKMRKY